MAEVRKRSIMPVTLASQTTNRKAAEDEVLSLLQSSDETRRVTQIVRESHFDEVTLLRAIFRLAASGRVRLDQHLNISLP